MKSSFRRKPIPICASCWLAAGSTSTTITVLRQLTDADGVAEAVTVERLTHETVREVVASLGLDANSLNSKQLDLLSVPLHLKLLSELVGDEEIRALNFEKAQDLYERFWQFKQQDIENRLGRPVQWTKSGICPV